MAHSSQYSLHKFGGTSVADGSRYRKVAEILRAESNTHKAVVVSAMAKITDGLIELTELARLRNETYLVKLETLKQKHIQVLQEILPQTSMFSATKVQDLFEKDFKNIEEILRAIWLVQSATEKMVEFVSGHGEIWSAQILNAYINSQGIACDWLDARKVLFVGSGETSVRVNWQRSEEKFKDWLNANKPSWTVVTGFIASSEVDGTPTTLKRNGSDFSASIFGVLFGAKEIQIWTDVDGVMSADPRLVPEAVVLSDLSYAEVTELAYFGAKVVHPSTMAPAMKKQIPIWIKNTFNLRAIGTKIHAISTSNHPVKGFSTVEKVALINVEGTGMMGIPGIASRLFSTLKEISVSVIMISQASSEHSICIAIPEAQGESAKRALMQTFGFEMQNGWIQDIALSADCSILAAVGDNMAHHPGSAGRFLGALGAAGVNVRAIAQGSSERNISVVVSREQAIRGLRAVHSAFFLSDLTLSIGVVGIGGIGSTLLEQMSETENQLRSKYKIDLRVRGMANSKRMLLSEKSIAIKEWQAHFAEKSEAFDLERFRNHIKADHLPHSVIVDCTATNTLAKQYSMFFEQGLHVITPNKKGSTAAWSEYSQMVQAWKKNRRHYLYETTVGAGLPIINTLRELLRTGDQVLSIEGVFSGTLSFIFNSFSEIKSFSEVVVEAKNRGYTEPDPREDLSGTDVARKLVILAREMGSKLELSDVQMDPLLPEDLARGTVEEFLTKLPSFDGKMLQMLKDAEARGQVLRFVGSIDESGKAQVSLKKFDKTHAFARLSATDNIVAFTTKRYSTQPLIVQGPGAGREVTAGGVFADILRLCSYLGAQL